MPRKIKEVIIGLPDSPVIKQDWDITPVTQVITPELSFVQTANVVDNNGQFLVDVTGVAESQYVSVVKTNLTLEGLGTNRTFKYGLVLDDLPLPTTPCAFGIYLAPNTRTAEQVRSEIETALFGGGQLLNSRVMAYSLVFNTTQQTVITAKIPTTLTPTGVVRGSAGVNPNLAIENGYKMGLLISNRAEGLSIGRFDVNADGVTYDLNGVEPVLGHTIPETHTIFYFSLITDTGTGLSNIAFTPSLTIDSPSYDTVGTSAENFSIDWAAFANPIRPNQTTVTQATLPADVRIGQFYRVVIDPSYVGPDPTPMGYPLKNMQTVLVNAITGPNSITAYVDNETLIELVDDAMQPVVQQQTAILQSIADLGTLVQQTQDDVNVALLNAPELIIYVKNTAISLPDPDLAMTTAVVSNSFDEAYVYALTLPKFIRKRIVIDDRLSGGFMVYGVSGKMYHLLENNITISSYTIFNGLYDSGLVSPNAILLAFDCTGLKLDKFKGNYFSETTPIPRVSPTDFNLPLANALLANILLGDNSYFYTSDEHVDLVSGQHYFDLGRNSNLFLTITQDPNIIETININKGQGSYVQVSVQNIYLYAPNNIYKVIITKAIDSPDDFIDYGPSGVKYYLADTDPYRDIDGNGTGYNKVIRSVTDLPFPDYLNRILISSGKYLFVKTLELNDKSLYVQAGTPVELNALPGVKITTTDVPNILNEGVCVDNGINWVNKSTGGGVPAIENTGDYKRDGGRIIANKMFRSNPDAYSGQVHRFVMSNVEHEGYVYGYYQGYNEIGQCVNFTMTNIKLSGFVGNSPYVQFNLNSIDSSQRYSVNGLYGIHGYNNATMGLFNIVNAYGVTGVLANVISLKNISLGNGTYPLVTKDGLLYPYKSDTLIDYDGKKYFVQLINGSGNSRGTAFSSPLNLSGEVRSGFARNLHIFQHLRNNSTVCKIKMSGYVSKTVSTGGNARVTAVVGRVSGTGDTVLADLTPVLAAANTPVYFEFTTITELYNADALLLNGCLAGSQLDYLYFTNVTLEVTEIY